VSGSNPTAIDVKVDFSSPMLNHMLSASESETHNRNPLKLRTARGSGVSTIHSIFVILALEAPKPFSSKISQTTQNLRGGPHQKAQAGFRTSGL
jgi:hypothetical protein